MRFLGKVAVVTGGSSGIGRAVVRLMTLEGAKVYNLDITPPAEEDEGFIPCDVADYEQVSHAIQTIADREKSIELFFANAGVHKFANVEETSLDELHRVVAINVFSVFYAMKEILPIMRGQESGKILIMGSDQSVIGKGQSAVYGMTKAAVAQLAKSTAIDYAPYNIQVNCIGSGTCHTALVDKAVQEFQAKTGTDKASVFDMLEKAQPINRLAKPEEIAKLACFLLSDENSYMTGSLVMADGGYTCQ